MYFRYDSSECTGIVPATPWYIVVLPPPGIAVVLGIITPIGGATPPWPAAAAAQELVGSRRGAPPILSRLVIGSVITCPPTPSPPPATAKPPCGLLIDDERITQTPRPIHSKQQCHIPQLILSRKAVGSDHLSTEHAPAADTRRDPRLHGLRRQARQAFLRQYEAERQGGQSQCHRWWIFTVTLCGASQQSTPVPFSSPTPRGQDDNEDAPRPALVKPAPGSGAATAP